MKRRLVYVAGYLTVGAAVSAQGLARDVYDATPRRVVAQVTLWPVALALEAVIWLTEEPDQ